MCYGSSWMRMVKHKGIGIQISGVRKCLCVSSQGSHGRDVRPACQLGVGHPRMVGSFAVGVEMVAQALDKVVSLRRFYAVDEVGHSRDALLETGFVDGIGGHLCVDRLVDRGEGYVRSSGG